MKKMLGLFILAVMGFACVPANAAVMTDAMYGLVYKNTKEAGAGFSATAPTKIGSATCTSYFGIVALGDCSIYAAAKSAGIRSVSYTDTYTKNILGYKKLTVRVYGQ